MPKSDKLVQMEVSLSKVAGIPVEITVRDPEKLAFTISFDGENQEAQQKIKNYLGTGVVWDECGYDAPCEASFMYFTAKPIAESKAKIHESFENDTAKFKQSLNITSSIPADTATDSQYHLNDNWHVTKGNNKFWINKENSGRFSIRVNGKAVANKVCNDIDDTISYINGYQSTDEAVKVDMGGKWGVVGEIEQMKKQGHTIESSIGSGGSHTITSKKDGKEHKTEVRIGTKYHHITSTDADLQFTGSTNEAASYYPKDGDKVEIIDGQNKGKKGTVRSTFSNAYKVVDDSGDTLIGGMMFGDDLDAKRLKKINEHISDDIDEAITPANIQNILQLRGYKNVKVSAEVISIDGHKIDYQIGNANGRKEGTINIYLCNKIDKGNKDEFNSEEVPLDKFQAELVRGIEIVLSEDIDESKELSQAEYLRIRHLPEAKEYKFDATRKLYIKETKKEPQTVKIGKITLVEGSKYALTDEALQLNEALAIYEGTSDPTPEQKADIISKYNAELKRLNITPDDTNTDLCREILRLTYDAVMGYMNESKETFHNFTIPLRNGESFKISYVAESLIGRVFEIRMVESDEDVQTIEYDLTMDDNDEIIYRQEAAEETMAAYINGAGIEGKKFDITAECTGESSYTDGFTFKLTGKISELKAFVMEFDGVSSDDFYAMYGLAKPTTEMKVIKEEAGDDAVISVTGTYQSTLNDDQPNEDAVKAKLEKKCTKAGCTVESVKYTGDSDSYGWFFKVTVSGKTSDLKKVCGGRGKIYNNDGFPWNKKANEEAGDDEFLDQKITKIVGTEARTTAVSNPGGGIGYAIHWMGKGNDGSIAAVVDMLKDMGTWPQELAYKEADDITIGVFVPKSETATHESKINKKRSKLITEAKVNEADEAITPSWMDDFDSKDVDGWLCATEYPGVLNWYKKRQDDKFNDWWIAATPNWDGEGNTPIDLMDNDGFVEPIGKISQSNFTTFDEYAEAMKPYLTKVSDDGELIIESKINEDLDEDTKAIIINTFKGYDRNDDLQAFTRLLKATALPDIKYNDVYTTLLAADKIDENRIPSDTTVWSVDEFKAEIMTDAGWYCMDDEDDKENFIGWLKQYSIQLPYNVDKMIPVIQANDSWCTDNEDDVDAMLDAFGAEAVKEAKTIKCPACKGDLQFDGMGVLRCYNKGCTEYGLTANVKQPIDEPNEGYSSIGGGPETSANEDVDDDATPASNDAVAKKVADAKEQGLKLFFVRAHSGRNNGAAIMCCKTSADARKLAHSGGWLDLGTVDSVKTVTKSTKEDDLIDYFGTEDDIINATIQEGWWEELEWGT